MTREDHVLAVLAASNGAIHTPVQVQKLFFLLDKKAASSVGGPYFNFQPDDYGPFDKAVYLALESLAARGLVSVEAVPDLRRKVYRTTPSGQKEGARLLASMRPDVATYIHQLSAWVRSLSFAQLVSAIYAEFPAMKARSIFRAA